MLESLVFYVEPIEVLSISHSDKTRNGLNLAHHQPYWSLNGKCLREQKG